MNLIVRSMEGYYEVRPIRSCLKEAVQLRWARCKMMPLRGPMLPATNFIHLWWRFEIYFEGGKEKQKPKRAWRTSRTDCPPRLLQASGEGARARIASHRIAATSRLRSRVSSSGANLQIQPHPYSRNTIATAHHAPSARRKQASLRQHSSEHLAGNIRDPRKPNIKPAHILPIWPTRPAGPVSTKRV